MMSINTILGRPSAPGMTPGPLCAIRSEILDIERYAPSFADPALINLSLNEHYALPSPGIRETLRSLHPTRLVSYDMQTTEALRAKIAARESVSINNILISPGSSAAVQTIFSCLNPGAVLLPSTCWDYYKTLSQLTSLPVTTYEVSQTQNEFVVDVALASAAMVRCDPVLTLFINPHMPTGALAKDVAIAAFAKEKPEMLVLVDEAYQGFSPSAKSLASTVLEVPNLIVSKTFSKYFGLAGIRIGYLVAHETVINELQKAASPFSMPSVCALLALAALEDETYYRDVAAEMMAVKAAFSARISKLPGVHPYRSHANFLLVEFESPSHAQRAERNVMAAGCKIRSARSYGLPHFVRITVGTEEAMNRVTCALEEGAVRRADA